MTRIVLCISLVLLIAVGAQAHGGKYIVPPDAQGGNDGGGGSVEPPTNPGGGASPSAGVTAGTGVHGTSARTTSPRTKSRSDTRNSVTSGGLDFDPGYDRWEFWWEQNKDRFLALRERLKASRTVSGGLSLLSGQGRREAVGVNSRPDPALIDGEVVPALIGILQSTDEADLADSIVLALARMASEATRDAVLTAIVSQLDHRMLSVQSSAALALGVLGDPRAEEILAHVAVDDSKGRQHVGVDRVPSLVRAFGALGLGLLATPDAPDTLLRLLRDLPDSEADVKVCTIVGLGLLGVDHPRAREVVTALREELADRRLDPTIASYIPTALARLDARDALPDLAKAFTDRDASHEVRQSVAIALGRLATPGDEGFTLLLDALEASKDSQTRHFSLIALAEIVERAADAGLEFDAGLLIPALLRELDGKGASRAHRPWAALAAAICARVDPRIDAAVQERLRLGFAKNSDPSVRSAFVLALGLVDDRGAGDDVDEAYRDTKELGFQGYAALSLGFLRHVQSIDVLRFACTSKVSTPSLRLSTATALGLMGDVGSIDVLVEAMKGAETLGAVSSIANALALVGDSRAVDPLLAVARDGSRPAVTRGFACVALGLLCERGSMPFNARIRADNNYRAQVPAIAEVLDIL